MRFFLLNIVLPSLLGYGIGRWILGPILIKGFKKVEKEKKRKSSEDKGTKPKTK